METMTINNDMTMGGAAAALLANRYRVVRQLGQGGMGSVWLAEDTELDNRQVAIKMLPSILLSNKRAYNQIKSEALVSLKLVHPNIVQVRAFEENNGNPFLVMDYIDGQTLDDYLAEKGKLSEEETLKLLKPVAAALDYAHTQGVVHRDVKPGNVMIRKDGTPFVLDFGIARDIQETMTRVTGKLSSGTLLYMSPEQLYGDAPKPAQDIYSFAAMAYECLKGEPPFGRGGIEDQIKHKLPEPLGPQFANCGKGVMAGLAKTPEARLSTCATCAEVLLVGARGPRDHADVGTPVSKTRITAALLAVLVLAVGGGWWWNVDRKHRVRSGSKMRRPDISWSIWLDEWGRISDNDRTNNVNSKIKPTHRKLPALNVDYKQKKEILVSDNGTESKNILACEDADFQPVYFGFDSAVVPQKEIVKIDLVAEHLSRHEDRFVVIEGNCDRRENKYLSVNRAEVLCKYLIQHGVAQERIRFYGRVANNPMAEGCDEPAFAKNRRCEFLVTTNSVVLFNKCKYRRGNFCDREEIIHSDGSSTVFKSSVVEKKSDTSFSGPTHFILHDSVIDHNSVTDELYVPYTGPTKEYVVQRGDYLAKISKKFNVPIMSIRQLNPSITNEVISVGQKILIPTNRDFANDYSATNITHKSKLFVPYVGPTKEYIVTAGDTLGKIAYENGITIRQLKTLNNITADTFRVGQIMIVPDKQVQPLEVDSKDSRKGWMFR